MNPTVLYSLTITFPHIICSNRYLQKKEIKAVGTVQVNRFSNPPFSSDKVFKKETRGSTEEVISADGITSESTKFGYIISALPSRFATEVKDVLLSPPTSNPYTKLRNELIRGLCAAQEKTRQLLERKKISDRKPSQFLRHLQSLADPSISEPLLKTLWMRRLPKCVQVALAIIKDQSLADLASPADNIIDATRPLLSTVAETSSKSGKVP